MFSQSLIHAAPHEPGVYLMLSSSSEVLYVGKAKDLAVRLTSYLRVKTADHNKTLAMLKNVVRVDTIITNTEKEALILEASLIKKHKPKYNIILRDDKSYPYIKLTIKEEWPRAFMSRRKRNDGARYFGPYSSSSSMWATLKLISSLFPLRKCKGKNIKKRPRPCLNNQIGKCLAPCVSDTHRDVYADHVKNIVLLLEGKNNELIKDLKHQMNKASNNLQFERAAVLRDQISSLEKTLEKQLVSAGHSKNQDVFGYVQKDGSVSLAVLTIRDGLISGNRTFFFPTLSYQNNTILSQVLSQFYSHKNDLPSEILLPFQPENYGLHLDHFNDLSDRKIYIKIPKRGDGLKLIQLANSNASNLFEEMENKKSSWQNLQNQLQKKLKLITAPSSIECLDISNLSGKNGVGSLVHYDHGEPNKKKYRHYKIQTIDTPNDYSMMKEVLERRFEKAVKENNLPDLFMVDGGKGHLGIALSVAESFGIHDTIEWIGIAKEHKDEGEKLYKPGRKNPILLQKNDPALLFLMRIRDESHRFGITFHRKLRNKQTLLSDLDAIPGIGPAKKKLLLQHFGSLKRIKNSSIDELTSVPGIGQELANAIHSCLIG